MLNLVLRLNLPFTFVEATEFRNLKGYASSEDLACKLPSAIAIRKWIFETHGQEKNCLKEEMKQLPRQVSFTWTSKNQHAFQCVVATWVDSCWELYRTLIAMDEREPYMTELM